MRNFQHHFLYLHESFVGPYLEVRQCYRTETFNLDESIEAQNLINRISLQPEQGNVVSDTNNELSAGANILDTLEENANTPWWVLNTTELPWFTIEDHTHNSDTESSTIDMSVYDGIVNDDDNGNRGNALVRDDTIHSESIKENMPVVGQLVNVLDMSFLKIPVQQWVRAEDKPSPESLTLSKLLPTNLEKEKEINDQSAYLTTTVSYENDEKNSIFLSITITMCR